MNSILLNLLLEDDEEDFMIFQNMLMINNYFLLDTIENTPVSRKRKRRVETFREEEEADIPLDKDYFIEEDKTYPDDAEHTLRNFKMNRTLFNRIQAGVVKYDNYFEQKYDAARRLGFSSMQKISAAIRLLAFGLPVNLAGENLKMGESTTIESLHRFCSAIIEVFGKEYLRAPNSEDMKRLSEAGESRGFPGMIGSLGCVHWEWKDCPTALQHGMEKNPVITLEAAASNDLWIWHALFGVPGPLNEINVLGRSNLVNDIINQSGPEVSFTLYRNRQYNMKGYYLTDSTYPSCDTFVRSLNNPVTNNQRVCIQ